MYSYIIGEFVEMTPEGIVIENNGLAMTLRHRPLQLKIYLNQVNL